MNFSDLAKAIQDKSKSSKKKYLKAKTLLDKEITGFFSTGSILLDYLIRRPGIPQGRIVEFSGWRSSGKSTLAVKCAASCQAQGGIVFVFDTEDAWTDGWVRSLGLDPEQVFMFNDTSTIEEIFEAISLTILDTIPEGNQTPVLIIFDSLSAVETQQEHDKVEAKGFGAKGMALGSHARVVSAALRNLTKKLSNRNATLLICSQLKEAPTDFGGPTTKKLGGHAVEYHAALLIELGHKKFMKAQVPFGKGTKEETVGVVTRAIVKKSKLGGPAGVAQDICVYYDGGPRREGELFEVAVDAGIVLDNRGWLEFADHDDLHLDTDWGKFRKTQWEEILLTETGLESYILSQLFPDDLTVKGEDESD